MREFKDVYKQIDDIAEWMTEYTALSGTGGYVVGLSGGVDSALVAALAVKAVTKEFVHGVIMPIDSDPKDKLEAILVAKTLDISFDEVDMTDAYVSMVDAYPSYYEDVDLRLRSANVKARLRMTMLYQFASEFGFLVAGTGNKSEDTIGYFTKYGDGGVDILPIVDFYKWEVREMAKVLGIPERIVYRTSTAGLWEGQTDEGELGMTYDELDSILYYLETGQEYPVNLGDKIEKVKSMIKQNKHKNEYPPSFKRR